MEMQNKLPHNFEALMKEVNLPLEPAYNDLIPLLQEGVFLDNDKIYYWLDKLGCNCFKLFARRLSITWSEDPRYWKWERAKEVRNTEVEVAHLVNVCWLEVRGTFKTSYLSPGVPYEVVFVVKMEEPSHGWNTPVTLKLESPDGRTQERREKLGEKPRGKWIELPVGDFVNNPLKNEEIKFSLFQYKDGAWKSGLVIKAAILRPKKCFG